MAKTATTTTAIAEALTTAGYRHPRDRLYAIVDAVYGNREFRTRDAQVEAIIRKVINDAALLWALFESFANTAVGKQLEDAMLRRRAMQAAAKKQAEVTASSGASASSGTIQPTPQGASGARVAGPTPAQRARARQEVNREQAAAATTRVLSKLDLFKINGRPIGDCTPQEALAWRASRVRDARFVWLLCAGLPHDKPIREFAQPADADAFYARAQEEKSNE